ncbi:MAG: DNA topoisomerase I [Candidatus Andersenbacteria bacterium RIFCSPHIGHO2_12_FULL_45_11b]|uniref:DNA topoisomerase 1 n=1 Tax=Candidatus Andersenbacteria bacterium RIFCSPHIGHO2_12_FULL_45_11b TaxID=1797282 RepID=A0A1G1X7Q6_9BACT|nr:MAG: DNA topoisomerase I [Candidatus Andersenbacteria bacterium RIFCSPHIGHO2_12_FULL_45_11b]
MNLVIVESPAKAKTIQKYLGKGFVVKSSYGHVRDLPKSKIGVAVEKNFTPSYVIPDKAKERIKELKKYAAKADIIYFATDEDREGEAIAWHLYEVLAPKKEKAKRITFHEITKTAIQHAIENPRELDINLVNAQQARRVLDRLVGYELSPLLWNKVRRGLSAGRVQSVAVRLIVQREQEIAAFKSDEYWTLEALLKKDKQEFSSFLKSKKGKAIPKLGIKSKEEVSAMEKELSGATYTVSSITTKEKKRTPPAPFTTSTLQQAAFNQLGFSSKRTMMIAQQLYENGHITYMRTDSLNLAAEAVASASATIKKLFGDNYALAAPRVFSKKSKGAQEAHEAIRPTDPSQTPDDLAAQFEPSQQKLYRLIWQRMVASQMADAALNQTAIDITAGAYTFRANGMTVAFDGFVRALGEKAAFQESVLPKLAQGDTLDLTKLSPEQHFTQPPARYSEATLVKALEEHGIGRPSTYAPTIDVIQKRGYVEKNEEKRLAPTEIGTLVNSVLTEHFPNIVDIDFTANMEASLDDVASGDKKWQPVIKEFYDPFHKLIGAKNKELKKEDLTQEATEEKCPKCGSDVVIKLGRFGKFKACSNYPECKHTEPLGDEKKLEEEYSGKTCPDCGKPLVVKRGRFGAFLGCSGYPECKHITPIVKDTGVKCPVCKKGSIIEKKSRRGKTFFACDQYPECKNAYWSKPTGETCPQCSSLLVYGAKNTIRCSSKTCKFTKENEEE